MRIKTTIILILVLMPLSAMAARRSASEIKNIAEKYLNIHNTRTLSTNLKILREKGLLTVMGSEQDGFVIV